MSIVELDSKGRITLSKAIREMVGTRGRVLAINAGDHRVGQARLTVVSSAGPPLVSSSLY